MMVYIARAKQNACESPCNKHEDEKQWRMLTREFTHEPTIPSRVMRYLTRYVRILY